MAITVKHKYVSGIADSGDTSVVQPSNWNDTHDLVGLGTMAEQDSNNVTITGGTISGTTVSGYVPTSQKGVANGVATLDSGGQIPIAQIPPLGDLNYQGAWDASANNPTLTSSVGTKGYYYVVSVNGSTNLNGITDWKVGDWAVFNGSIWQKIDNTDSVTSVNGQTGAVVLTTANVAEVTNLYYTDARARASVSAGTGITYSSSTGVIANSAPDQTVAITAGTGVSVTGTYPNFTVTNTSPSSGGTVTSVSGTAPVVSSGGNTPTISMAKATGSVDGYLSSTDWTTFNNKQAAGSYLTAVTADTPLSGLGTSGSHLVIATANTTTTGVISSTDWNTFNGKQASLVSGTNIKTVNSTSLLGSGDVSVGVTSVTGTAPVVSSGGATPAISMAAATGSVNGYLSSTDWTTFNGKAPAVTYTTSYIPYGQGTTTPNLSSSFTFDGTTQTAPVQRASNGIIVNSKTVSASYSIASGDSAMSVGPITVATGQSVTVASGSRWVII